MDPSAGSGVLHPVERVSKRLGLRRRHLACRFVCRDEEPLPRISKLTVGNDEFVVAVCHLDVVDTVVSVRGSFGVGDEVGLATGWSLARTNADLAIHQFSGSLLSGRRGKVVLRSQDRAGLIHLEVIIVSGIAVSRLGGCRLLGTGAVGSRGLLTRPLQEPELHLLQLLLLARGFLVRFLLVAALLDERGEVGQLCVLIVFKEQVLMRLTLLVARPATRPAAPFCRMLALLLLGSSPSLRSCCREIGTTGLLE